MDFTAIKNSVYRRTKTNSTSFPIADLTDEINRAFERVVALINQADMRWQWDDNNNTDLPIATAALVSGQQDYALTAAHLTIDRIEIKDTSGNWTKLKPIDQHDVRRQALASYRQGGGVPLEYDKIGASVFLYPIPNYSQAASIKIYFTRGPLPFTTGDTTAQPGFNSLFHDLIPLWVSYNYAVRTVQKTAPGYLESIARLEQSLIDFYGQRSRDERSAMRPARHSNK